MNKVENDNVEFSVRVVPRSSRSEIVGPHGGMLRIKIASPPVDGAANDELIKLLSKEFGVPRSSVEIVSGHTSRTKVVRVHGATAADRLRRLLQPK